MCLFEWRYLPEYLYLVKKWDAPLPVVYIMEISLEAQFRASPYYPLNSDRIPSLRLDLR